MIGCHWVEFLFLFCFTAFAFTWESAPDPWLFTTNNIYPDFKSRHCYLKHFFSIVSLNTIFHRDIKLLKQVTKHLNYFSYIITNIQIRGAPIRYSGSVSFRYWHFLLERGIGLKPHKSYKHIKQHKVFVHYISSVLKPLHSLMFGTDEYLSQVRR